MTRKTIIPALIITVCIINTAVALPTIKITTATPAPTSAAANYDLSRCQNAKAAGTAFMAPAQDYTELKEFAISDAGAGNTGNIASDADSIRLRGNTTSFMMPSAAAAKSYRIKFDKRQSLLGMTESKSWVLLANFYDPTQMLSAVAFELAARMGLDYSREYRFVKVDYNGNDIGVYLLTAQIAANKYAGVNADIENGGWLAEFIHWGPGDAEDCKRFYLPPRLSGDPQNCGTSGREPCYKYDLNMKIRAPELDELDPPKITYDGVKNDVDELINKLNDDRFPENGYRDLMDVRSFAVINVINLFMDNRDWNTAGDLGGLGSNFFYKENKDGKIKAGPVWDLDLAAGSPGVGGGLFFSNESLTRNLTPDHALYQKLWSDSADGFRTCYAEAWNEHKEMIRKMGEDGGFIDTLLDMIAPEIDGKFAMNEANASNYCVFSLPSNPPCGVTYNVGSYRAFVGRMKSWWNARYTNFDNAVRSINVSGTCPVDPVDPPDPPSSVAARSKAAPGGRVYVTDRGITVSAVNKAQVKIYSLDGREVRKVNLTKGNHTVRLNDLPKGIYAVRTVIDGRTRTLRVPVR